MSFYILYAWGRVEIATVVLLSWDDFKAFAGYIAGLSALLTMTRLVTRLFRG